MITSLAALIFQSCLVKKVNSDLGIGIFYSKPVIFHSKAMKHRLWMIGYESKGTLQISRVSNEHTDEPSLWKNLYGKAFI